MNSFEEFYKNFGFQEYPFSTFTTENEKGKERNLFISPSCYSPIIQNFRENNTILLTGDRGTGKTAILLDFERNTDKNNSLICIIDDYSKLSKKFNSSDLYKFLITNLTTTLFEALSTQQNRLKHLNQEEKVLLSYLLKNFVPIVSKRLLKNKIEKIQIPWYQRVLTTIFNKSRPLINYTATAGGIFIEQYLAQHFKSLPPIDKEINIKDFFPELPLNIDDDFEDIEAGYQLINDICRIGLKIGYKRIICFLDKLDEDARLNNDAELISQFIEPILTDNKLLLNENLQLIISIWLTPFNFILDQVRSQKHYCPILKWDKNDLEKAINKRLEAYSNKSVSDYKELFEDTFDDGDFDLLFDLANSNPRDLWHLFDKIFNSQYSERPHTKSISKDILNKAITDFITNFNYFEYYPRKKNARSNTMDFYSYTTHLLKLDDISFTKNKLNDLAGTGSSTNHYVVGMERIGLIVNAGQESGIVHYKIKDPKVRYALKNNIKIERKK